VEIILAFCAAFRSSRVRRRLSSAVCFGSPNPDRGCAAFLGCAIGVSQERSAQTVTPSRPVAIGVGAGVGFLSGLTGAGGGIFLTPLLLFCQWAHIRQAGVVSALFIWVNSIAGLVGYFTKVHSIPSLGLILAAAAIIGGIMGSYLGSRHLAVRVISLFLATVLLIAGVKLIFTR
jgi:uncharacterized membrane protein YfcA